MHGDRLQVESAVKVDRCDNVPFKWKGRSKQERGAGQARGSGWRQRRSVERRFASAPSPPTQKVKRGSISPPKSTWTQLSCPVAEELASRLALSNSALTDARARLASPPIPRHATAHIHLQTRSAALDTREYTHCSVGTIPCTAVILTGGGEVGREGSASSVCLCLERTSTHSGTLGTLDGPAPPGVGAEMGRLLGVGAARGWSC